MRNIEFRGKNKETGKWEYGYISGIHTCHIDKKGNTTEIISYYINAGNRTVWAKTVGQFTGLCDKNGKKIFEGDILTGSYKDEEKEIKFVYTIEYSEEDCAFATREKTEDYATCLFDIKQAQTSEVIGNIHDNPELLEEI